MNRIESISVAFNDSGLPILVETKKAFVSFTLNEDGSLSLTADRLGLRLLAKACLGLAEYQGADGFHVHLDELYGLSQEIIINKGVS